MLNSSLSHTPQHLLTEVPSQLNTDLDDEYTTNAYSHKQNNKGKRKARKYINKSYLNIDIEKHTSTKLPALNRVSSRGNSEDSRDTYRDRTRIAKRPVARSVNQTHKRRRVLRTKEYVDPKDREAFVLPQTLLVRSKSRMNRLNLTSDEAHVGKYRNRKLNRVKKKKFKIKSKKYGRMPPIGMNINY